MKNKGKIEKSNNNLLYDLPNYLPSNLPINLPSKVSRQVKKYEYNGVKWINSDKGMIHFLFVLVMLFLTFVNFSIKINGKFWQGC